MRANRGHCTCKGPWDDCAYCRSLETPAQDESVANADRRLREEESRQAPEDR